ncbi:MULTISPECIES: DUF4335 domain-containing protein [Cyanophyceae]|uniref:DUF4335 domain-containing protein n=1 Tax=Cyanophyceae TaxID=3028117 RepID=UPI001688E999|nr:MULTISPECIES: DUF4335 domain-containing protein [Cyanophyceae]MBD1917782.1 DUF4335 domain-containing protein [Phormidium sp. FACHB-77]MBD2032900.1 DUF4335 domain-containing protein [Phormidium sp. FACHB-322]MBD2051648.1 DUF4335 domain-containing protein [Leptolyngbya sp. FACHB-60]
MTVQRQYTLPHCNLVLEGLSADANDPLSPLAVLMNAECHLPGATDTTLTGGREFLDSLVAAVSRYGQQLLSGVPYPRATGAAPPMVEIKPGDLPYHHHLIVQQRPLGEPINDVNALPPLDIQLTTVQFYDLMEAVDQLLADTQTLPDMKAQFQAVSRRLVRPTEPMTKRAAPAALGAAALAAAGLALFFVPLPEFEPTRPESEASAPAAASAVPGDPPRADGETGAAVASDGDGLDRLEGAPAITDAATIALLQSDVTQRLQEAWADAPRPSGDLAYRMAVSEDGDILGYQYENDLALEEVDNTPLPQLTFVPVAGAEPVRERVAQFVATFTPDGEVRLESTETPTEADASEADTSEADAAELPTLEDKVTDGDRIRELNSDLYDSILAELEPLSANEDLRFRVRLTEAGEVVGYEPVNAAAGLLANETPLPNLVTAADSTANQADFQVVFTERGVLEVNPWDGWPQ